MHARAHSLRSERAKNACGGECANIGVGLWMEFVASTGEDARASIVYYFSELIPLVDLGDPASRKMARGSFAIQESRSSNCI
jgi:hypothetical protein